MTVRETIDAWFAGALRSGPLARDTEAFNQVFVAVETLKDTLDPAPASNASTPTPNSAAPQNSTLPQGEGEPKE